LLYNYIIIARSTVGDNDLVGRCLGSLAGLGFSLLGCDHFLVLATDGLVNVLFVVSSLLIRIIEILLLLLILLILLLLLVLVMFSKILLCTAISPFSGGNPISIDSALLVVVHAFSFALSVEILCRACHLLGRIACIGLGSSLATVLDPVSSLTSITSYGRQVEIIEHKVHAFFFFSDQVISYSAVSVDFDFDVSISLSGESSGLVKVGLLVQKHVWVLRAGYLLVVMVIVIVQGSVLVASMLVVIVNHLIIIYRTSSCIFDWYVSQVLVVCARHTSSHVL